MLVCGAMSELQSWIVFLSPPRFTLMCDLMCMQNSTLIPPSNPSQSSRLCALCSCQRDWLYASQPYVSRVGFTESLSIHCLIVFWWRVHPIAALLWILRLDSHSLSSYSGGPPYSILPSLLVTHTRILFWPTAPLPCHLFSHHISVTLTISRKYCVCATAQTNPRPLDDIWWKQVSWNRFQTGFKTFSNRFNCPCECTKPVSCVAMWKGPYCLVPIHFQCSRPLRFAEP